MRKSIFTLLLAVLVMCSFTLHAKEQTQSGEKVQAESIQMQRLKARPLQQKGVATEIIPKTVETPVQTCKRLASEAFPNDSDKDFVVDSIDKCPNDPHDVVFLLAGDTHTFDQFVWTFNGFQGTNSVSYTSSTPCYGAGDGSFNASNEGSWMRICGYADYFVKKIGGGICMIFRYEVRSASAGARAGCRD